jgi:hypothetical protein
LIALQRISSVWISIDITIIQFWDDVHCIGMQADSSKL